nr:VOC family protein [Pedobacter sp. UBA5917]
MELDFEYHKHGNSPFHYSTNIGSTVFEIYPLAKDQKEADKNLRLGFGLENFEEAIMMLKATKVPFVQEPAETAFGFMAIIIDPDGRKIELYRK